MTYKMCDDPDHDQMMDALIDFIVAEGHDPDVTEDELLFGCEEAIYWFASEWHGGQGSNLYAVLSTSPYRPGANERGPSNDEFYDVLVDHFVVGDD